MVREERLELSQVSPLEPKSSASTNSATLAKIILAICKKQSPTVARQASSKMVGRVGIEPTTRGLRVRCSTN